ITQSVIFCFKFYYHHRDLHSFPTRRSSDLFANFGLRRNSSAEPFRNETIAETVVKHLKRAFYITLMFGILISCSENKTISEIQRSEEHTSELQSRENLVCRLLLEKKKQQRY